MSRPYRRLRLYFIITLITVFAILLLFLQQYSLVTKEQNKKTALTTEDLSESQDLSITKKAQLIDTSQDKKETDHTLEQNMNIALTTDDFSEPQELSGTNEAQLIETSHKKNKYETDLTLIEIGDFFYEDHSFSHELYDNKKCIGVVYNKEAPYYANIIAFDNYGSGNWSVYEKVQNKGVTYSVGGLKWRIPYVGEWVILLQNLAKVKCIERTEGYNIGTIEFDSQKALNGLERYHLHFDQEGWYWADGGYMSKSEEDECWSLSFVNECLYPGTESWPYFRYVADIEE